MEFIIGAGLLAAGLFMQRLFDHFWPSSEAERERQSALDREEREARRQYRAELAKPIIAALDRAAAMGEMRTIVSNSRMSNGPPFGSEDMIKFEQKIRSMSDEEHNELLADDLKKVFFEETPLIYRLDDGDLRLLVLSTLIGARAGSDQNETRKNLAKGYQAIGRWIAAAHIEPVVWAGEEPAG